LFGDGVSTKARIWLFCSFIVAFAGIIIAVWMGIVNWFQKDPDTSVYPGVAIIIQNVAIFGRYCTNKLGHRHFKRLEHTKMTTTPISLLTSYLVR
jgi:hypothetical protein